MIENPSEQFVSYSMPIGSPCRPFLFDSIPYRLPISQFGWIFPLLPPLARTLGPAELPSILGSVKISLLSWTATSVFMQGGGEYGTRIARLCIVLTDARDVSKIGKRLEFGSTVKECIRSRIFMTGVDFLGDRSIAWYKVGIHKKAWEPITI